MKTIYIYIYIYIYINFVCHVKTSKYMHKRQDIYLFKSFTSVSSKPSKTSLKVWKKPKYNFWINKSCVFYIYIYT